MNDIGKWIGVDEEGIWCSPFNSSYLFPTKKAVIEDIASANMDVRKTPKVIRRSEGVYVYSVKNCDTRTFSKEYAVIRLTQKNVEKYQKQISEQKNWEEE